MQAVIWELILSLSLMAFYFGELAFFLFRPARIIRSTVAFSYLVFFGGMLLFYSVTQKKIPVSNLSEICLILSLLFLAISFFNHYYYKEKIFSVFSSTIALGFGIFGLSSLHAFNGNESILVIEGATKKRDFFIVINEICQLASSAFLLYAFMFSAMYRVLFHEIRNARYTFFASRFFTLSTLESRMIIYAIVALVFAFFYFLSWGFSHAQFDFIGQLGGRQFFFLISWLAVSITLILKLFGRLDSLVIFFGLMVSIFLLGLGFIF